jgi:hypothetical protein
MRELLGVDSAATATVGGPAVIVNAGVGISAVYNTSVDWRRIAG